MKKNILLSLLCAAALGVSAQQKSWEGVHDISAEQARSNFKTPPIEFASHVIWGWEGEMDVKTIRKDLDSIKEKGFRAVIFEAGYNLPFEYLSDAWFKRITLAVKEAKKRGLKVWIIDEGKYPSGFAGGKFSKERPDLRMQAVVLCDTITVGRGEIVHDLLIDENAISAVAVSRSGAPNQNVEIKDHKISFNAGLDAWDILLARHDFRTTQTRAVNNPKGGKDTSNSVGDYLSPIAMQQFLDWTHVQYKKYLGKELGTTVLGFRGDEPDYGHIPWTPGIIDTFRVQKGYDPTPYLASFFSKVMTEDQKRVKADYWDVWSRLFAENFFKLQADWCDANGVAHITHLNNEHRMPVCVRAEGDFFRDLSKVQIPGVDAIWNQIWPDTVNNFPKLASSVGHVYGRPRAFSESFAAYYTSPNMQQAKYAVDYQMVRGINFFEFMFWMAGSKRANWMTDPGMKDLNEYTNRVTYLLAQGTPGAKVAMYYPTTTLWLGNNTADASVQSLTQTLLEKQRDFDYVNDDAFFEALTTGPGYLQNKSGQRYYTLIIPSVDVISAKAWKVIEEFSARGGKVLFWGKKPDMLVDKTFTEPMPFPDFKAGYHEPSNAWTPAVQAAMPDAEFALAAPSDAIRYNRRVLNNGELYFIFNESKLPQEFSAAFDKTGQVKIWDTTTSEVKDVDFKIIDGKTVVSFNLQPYQTIVLSIEKRNTSYSITDFGAKSDGQTLSTQAIQQTIDKAFNDGGGTVVIPAGNFLTGALFFKQGVDLNIQKGATLTSSVNPDDFPVIATRFEGTEKYWRCALLNFDNARAVRVFGEGTIDGRGVEWKSIPFGTQGRPRMLCFTRCDGGSITGLHLKDQASWGLHVLYTDGFEIKNVDIRAEHTIPSSDGIDIDSSNEVLVSGVFIDVNDDCISIKSGKDADGMRVGRPSENIIIEKCHFAYGHGGVAMGSEVSGGIRNVMIRDCVMDADNWGPIRFKSQPSRSGVVENITFRDITLNNTRSAFDINMEWRMIGHIAPAAERLTELKNIRIINVKGSAKSVGGMHGMEKSPISGVYFENCDITAESGLRLTHVKDVDLSGLKLHVTNGDALIRQ